MSWHSAPEHHRTKCGRGLAPDGGVSVTNSLTGPPPSGASLLPQGFCGAWGIGSVFVDRQHIVLELGVFAKPHRLIRLLRHVIITAGRHPQSHSMGLLGLLLPRANRFTPHHLRARVCGAEDVVENP